MLRQVKRYLRKRMKKYADRRAEKALLSALRREDRDLVSEVQLRRLTYSTKAKLVSILSTCRSVEDAGIPGLFIEAGCALGGSAIVMAKTKGRERPLLVFDVFGMIPAPTEEDTSEVHERYRTILEGNSVGIDGDKYYGYETNLFELVQTNLAMFDIDCQRESVSLIKGLVQDTMDIKEPVAFAHIDVDWYQPVLTCLRQIAPYLTPGGSIILDDYHDWGGCRKATDEYLSTCSEEFILDDSAGSMKMTRKQPETSNTASGLNGPGSEKPDPYFPVKR